MSTSPTSGIGCVHGSAISRGSSASSAGAQPVPGLLLVASTTARASMRSPSARSTTNPPPASAMSTTSALTAYEPGVAGELGGGGEQALDVAAEDCARRELVRLELRVVVVAQPAEEVLGVAREGAHARRGDVEEVAVVGGRVRLPATGRGCRVDELDAEARGERGDQVGRDQRAAGTGTDHDDPTVTLVRHHAARSVPNSPLNYLTKVPRTYGSRRITTRGNPADVASVRAASVNPAFSKRARVPT